MASTDYKGIQPQTMELQQTVEMRGISLSQGIAIGKAFIYSDILTRDISSYNISRKNVPYELKRITQAISEVVKELHKLSDYP